MLIIFEGITACLLVLLSCVVGIANGPVNMVFLYEKEVQDRAVEKGLITHEKIRRNRSIFFLCGILPYFAFVIISAYVINKARGFFDPFADMTAILLIEGVFDRLFIDWWWVDHTRAWIIPGTEDLRPYIDKKAMTRKCLSTVISFPPIAATISLIMGVFVK